MDFLELCCYGAATKKRYWPYLDTHVKTWYILTKLGKL